jgi:tetratricopeptide (TPR) repeat protein
MVVSHFVKCDMQKEYDKALECYEKALSMFRNTSSLGRDLVLENAHVMCMLGVSSFMLLLIAF